MKHSAYIILLILTCYLISHLFSLTAIPVFADEAIYIRWAQLIISDSSQYLFFALNDGKTPLFIWLLTPFLMLINDPLLAGRLLSVSVGLLQIIAISYLFYLTNNRKVSVLPALLVVTAPFWVIYHRLALMDGLLTLFTTTACIGIIKIRSFPITNNSIHTQLQRILKAKHLYSALALCGLSFGLALYTKLPAVLLVPALCFLAIEFPLQRPSLTQRFAMISISFFMGGVLFLSLALHPAFPQLFSRGSDFLYALSELQQLDILAIIIANSSFIITTFVTYLSLPLFLILTVVPLFHRQKTSVQFLLAGVIFFLPLILFAKVLHSRYLLPALPFLTLSLAHSLVYIQTKIRQYTKQKSIVLMCFIAIFFMPIQKSVAIICNPEHADWTQDDALQYFTDWSSGHGILEVVERLEKESSTHSVAVATEGYFGTLPDALIMYMFNKDQSRIYIEGVGQPVYQLQGKYLDKAHEYDKQWLVVNNFRMMMSLPSSSLIAEYCRPQEPENCLQLWDLSATFND